jgi:hypothetical protein
VHAATAERWKICEACEKVPGVSVQVRNARRLRGAFVLGVRVYRKAVARNLTYWRVSSTKISP